MENKLFLKTWRRRNNHTASFSWFLSFSLGRCRRMHFWCSHAAWGSQKKTIPMQHGKADTENCDTSRARTSILTDHWILLLWIFVDLGSAIWHPRREFKGKLENDKNMCFFWKSTKWKMLLKPLVGARFRSEEVTTTNNSIWAPKVFLGRGWDLCQNLHRTRTRAGDVGRGGSTIIFF